MNEREFAVIVSETKKVVLSAIREHLPSRFVFALDDIVQETYFRAYKSLMKGSFRNEAALSTWLYTIARNETYRASKRLLREEQKAEKAGADKKDPRDSEEIKEELERAVSLVNKMSERHKPVFDMLLRGKNENEIALALGIPNGTVKSRISRGRAELKRLREEEDYGF